MCSIFNFYVIIYTKLTSTILLLYFDLLSLEIIFLQNKTYKKKFIHKKGIYQ